MTDTHTGRDPRIVELFAKAIWEIDQKKIDGLSMDTQITTLGIDSVAMLEVIGFLEEELEIHLPEERLQRVQVLGDLADLIGELRPAK
ncbi:MAG: acyl carrier protein [Deltaproteobacteria bacterium]|nr:acyl carrier protein [Deltaproteobacteria bacterium]